MDVFPREKRSEIMSKIRSNDTKPERDFLGENPRAVPHPRLPFSPDFSVDGRPVFVDSAFWHGLVPIKRFEGLGRFWREKLFRNIVRDWSAIAFYTEVGGAERVGRRATWKDVIGA